MQNTSKKAEATVYIYIYAFIVQGLPFLLHSMTAELENGIGNKQWK